VKKHKGKIHVDTEAGKGSTFMIELQIENPFEAGEINDS
jgi:signal transduction histidine kinase